MKTYEITLASFDGGRSDDNRDAVSNQCSTVSHFDIHKYKNRLVPNRSFVADMNDGSSSTGMKQYNLTDFVWDASRQRVWGIGTKGDGTGTKVFYKGLLDPNWTAVSSTTTSLTDATGSSSTDTFTIFTGSTSTYGLINGTPLLWTAVTAPNFTNATTYYAGNVTGSTFKVYTDAALTNLVDLTVNYSNVGFQVTSGTGESTAYLWPGSAIIDLKRNCIYMILNNAGVVGFYCFSLGTPGFTQIGSGFTTSLSGTRISVPQPVRALDDNIYYGGSGTNGFYRLVPAATASWTDVSSLVPNNYTVASLANYGIYVAIGLQRNAGGSDALPDVLSSKVHIYDLVNLDPIQVVDWGDGSLKVLETINGILCGISDRYTSSVLGNDTGTLLIKEWGGGTATAAETVKEVHTVSTGSTFIPYYKSYKRGLLSFYAKLTTENGTEEGIWTFGRTKAGDQYSLSIDIATPQFATSVTSFARLGNFTYVSHSGDGSIARTDDTDTFSYTSSYESQVYIRDFENQLASVELTCLPLPAGASITASYRVNGTAPWKTAFTLSTTAQSYAMTSRSSSETELPKFHEIQFRIQSTGGGTPVRLRARYTELNSTSDDE